MSDNVKRALEQVVSIDGWIGEFDVDDKATVHADIVFRSGAFGGHPDSPVRFKIALKRAEVIIRVPHNEPLRVIKKSTARVSMTLTGTRDKQVTMNESAMARGGISLSNKPHAELTAEGVVSRESRTDVNFRENILSIIEQHFWTPDGHCGFEVVANTAVAQYLQGAPWDAEKQPRLSVKRNANRTSEGSPLSILIEIRCLREDIEILDLQEKDPEWRERLLRKSNRHINIAAAEQIIKNELVRLGFLGNPDMSEQYSQLLIADALVFEDEA